MSALGIGVRDLDLLKVLKGRRGEVAETFRVPESTIRTFGLDLDLVEYFIFLVLKIRGKSCA